jgi:hypothetical protein
MKVFYLIIFSISISLMNSSCSQNFNDVKCITVVVDPNRMENKYHVINIIGKDSIREFMKKLYNRKPELIKFYPRYSIEIKYGNKKETYLGNANHIKDTTGHTYKILLQEWEVFNY